MDLDDGFKELTLALDSKGSVTSTDENMFRRGAWERWEAKADAGEDASREVRFTLRLGPWLLDGKGTRPADGGLRCSVVRGSVLEGSDDPCCVGRFEMTLTLPEADTDTELPALEASHQARLDSRPGPPPRFSKGSFLGPWNLLLAMDGGGPEDEDVDATNAAAPSLFAVRLGEDGTFASSSPPAGSSAVPQGDDAPPAAVLGGRWGVWDASETDKRLQRGPSTLSALGTHVWLRVERDRCSSTLRGLAGLPVHEGFSLWGKPAVASAQAELQARSKSGGRSDLASGHCYFGTSADREWCMAGRFSLMRASPAEAVEDSTGRSVGRDDGDDD